MFSTTNVYLANQLINVKSFCSAAKTSPSRRSSDIISMLVNIYGSKELFVNEYRTLLADRILSQFNYDTEKEIRYLELLKLRFGETQLHYCEVMLKDVADSKRINQHIVEQRKKQEPNPEVLQIVNKNIPDCISFLCCILLLTISHFHLNLCLFAYGQQNSIICFLDYRK